MSNKMTQRRKAGLPKVTKSVGGRPSKFDPRMIEEGRRLASFGATDEEMAQFWGVTVKTFYNWQKEHPGFLQALKEGKEKPDAAVERSLFQRATGYEHDAVKILQYEAEPVIVPYTERYPPDATSMIFWLKNRRPDRWRDKSEVEVTGDLAERLDRAYQRRKPAT